MGAMQKQKRGKLHTQSYKPRQIGVRVNPAAIAARGSIIVAPHFVFGCGQSPIGRRLR